MEKFEEFISKLKITIDHYLNDFGNSFKMLFCIGKMGIKSPKNVGEKLNMAKSNVAILAGKLKFLKYIKQTKINKKEIEYSVTDLGMKKLDEKLEKIEVDEEEKQKIVENMVQFVNSYK